MLDNRPVSIAAMLLRTVEMRICANADIAARIMRRFIRRKWRDVSTDSKAEAATRMK
jgi:hypothetical protein